MLKVIYLIRMLPIILFIDWKCKPFIQDLDRWKKIYNIHGNKYIVLSNLLWRYPEFRNLFIYRNRFRRIFRYWIKLWYKPMNTLFIEAKEIGGGLFIQHGFSTMISAESIGENCWINQQVTIGYKDNTRAPVIGNNVMITCGAKVLGHIFVGDHSVIGANAVVVKNVECNSTMVGIPAHRIDRKG